jgi:hypothetical protein
MQTRQQKITTALQLDRAIKDGKEAFLLMSEIEKMSDRLEKMINEIKPTDLSDLDAQLKQVKEKVLNIKIPEAIDLSNLEEKVNQLKDKLNEETIFELEII